nr:MAG TPA: hypothetical protein [Caudoviricetes sp.]
MIWNTVITLFRLAGQGKHSSMVRCILMIRRRRVP